jgi:hypothetical protein
MLKPITPSYKKPVAKIDREARKAKTPITKPTTKSKTPVYTSKDMRDMKQTKTYKDPKTGKVKSFEKQRKA